MRGAERKEDQDPKSKIQSRGGAGRPARRASPTFGWFGKVRIGSDYFGPARRAGRECERRDSRGATARSESEPYLAGIRGFTRQGNRLSGNRRTVRRQYAARNWTFVRVLPGIAGYCRVVGPLEKVDSWELMVGSQKLHSPSPRPSPHGEGIARGRVLTSLSIMGEFQLA